MKVSTPVKLSLKRWTAYVILLFLVSLLGCESREAKIARHQQRGLAYLEEGNGQGAVVEFSNLVKLTPDAGEAHFLLGRAHALKEQYQTALSNYRKAAEMGLDSYALHLETAEAALQLGDLDAAEQSAQKCRAVRSDDPRVLYVLANVHAGRNNLTLALSLSQEALRLDKDFQPAWMTVGTIFIFQEQFDKALLALNKAGELDSKDVKPYLARSEVYTLQGKLDDAVEEVQGALAQKPDLVAAHLKLGELYINQSRFDAAIAAGDRAQELEPNAVHSHLLKGAAYLGLKKYDLAEKELILVTRENPESAIPYYLLSQVHYFSGHYQQAITMAHDALAKAPGHTGANLLAGASAFALGYRDDAIKSFQAAVESDPQNPLPLNLLGSAYLKMERLDDAIVTFERALALDSDSAEARENLGVYYGAAGNLARAIEEFESTIQLDPEQPGARVRLIMSHLLQGNIGGAKAETRAALKKWPDDPMLLTLLGSAHARAKEPLAAIAQWDKVIAVRADYLAPYLSKARVLLEMNRKAEARQSLTAAIDAMPASALPHLVLAKLHIQEKESARAIAEYEKALAKEKNLYQAMLPLAELYMSTGNIDGAVAQYEKLLTVRPDNSAAMNNLAWIYAEKGVFLPKARRLAEKATAVSPNDPGFQDTLGWIQHLMGDHREARGTLERALALNPGEPIIHFHLGMVLKALGENEEARGHLETALEKGGSFIYRNQALQALSELS